VATLTNIIRSTALNQIAQSQNVSAASPIEDIKKEGGVSTVASMVNKYDPPPPATAPMAEFFEKTHDEFMAKLHDDFLLRYGVTISNIRIEAFKIMDDDLAEQISKHALTTAQIENEMVSQQRDAALYQYTAMHFIILFLIPVILFLPPSTVRLILRVCR